MLIAVSVQESGEVSVQVIKGDWYTLNGVIQDYQMGISNQREMIEMELVSFHVVVNNVSPAAVQVYVINIYISWPVASVVDIQVCTGAIGRSLVDVNGTRATRLVYGFTTICCMFSCIYVRLGGINGYTTTATASSGYLKFK